jgi:transcriptional regulator with XRE-family HTH domain
LVDRHGFQRVLKLEEQLRGILVKLHGRLVRPKNCLSFREERSSGHYSLFRENSTRFYSGLDYYSLNLANKGRPLKARSGELGRYVAAQRELRGFNVRELAEAANVSYRALSKLELGHTVPRPEFLLRLAQALDVYPDELLRRAAMTRYLRPAPPPAATVPLGVEITSEERDRLMEYLQFLRYRADIRASR